MTIGVNRKLHFRLNKPDALMYLHLILININFYEIEDSQTA
jgi:hypothetical protein